MAVGRLAAVQDTAWGSPRLGAMLKRVASAAVLLPVFVWAVVAAPPWVFPLVVATVASALLATVAGIAASLRALGRRPVEVLRTTAE